MTDEWTKVHPEELYNLYFIRMAKSRMKKWKKKHVWGR
jgi:hypothetical protein